MSWDSEYRSDHGYVVACNTYVCMNYVVCMSDRVLKGCLTINKVIFQSNKIVTLSMPLDQGDQMCVLKKVSNC